MLRTPHWVDNDRHRPSIRVSCPPRASSAAIHATHEREKAVRTPRSEASRRRWRTPGRATSLANQLHAGHGGGLGGWVGCVLDRRQRRFPTSAVGHEQSGGPASHDTCIPSPWDANGPSLPSTSRNRSTLTTTRRCVRRSHTPTGATFNGQTSGAPDQPPPPRGCWGARMLPNPNTHRQH